jgi:hypothetical protein
MLFLDKDFVLLISPPAASFDQEVVDTELIPVHS